MSRGIRRAVDRVVWPGVGLALAVALWSLGARQLSDVEAIRSAFAPTAGFAALGRLLAEGALWEHILLSLQRIGISLLLALLIAVPVGIWVGLSPLFAKLTGTLFQFLRMVSPLSWMPLAVMALGVGEAPVVFLLTFAAVWPILLNTAAGVAALDRSWLQLAHSLSATRSEIVRHIVLPGIVTHVLTGFRLALGIAWIVLVPAEMLGVSAGMGYFILDTRDRLAYDELMAGIVVIGCLGFALDVAARAATARWVGKNRG
ncbi:ABC transporter permease [Comamonas antarctica]|uniref:ABC transporter permease n=1 Tax=Comamonas antarctica TaxID=2743470 RepID=UPI0028E6C90C|nr:ABC transporter permease [Comamonas antarctica]